MKTTKRKVADLGMVPPIDLVPYWHDRDRGARDDRKSARVLESVSSHESFASKRPDVTPGGTDAGHVPD